MAAAVVRNGRNEWCDNKGLLPLDFGHHVIAQDRGYKDTKRYNACDGYKYMCERLGDISNGYEVIECMARPVWLFVDYDGDKGEVKFTDAQVRAALSKLILDVLYEVYNIRGATAYWSTATTKMKTSIHLKMNVLFADMYGLKEFMFKVQDKAVKEQIPEFMTTHPKKESLIDVGIYGNFRCYRCVGMSKYGKDNELVCMDGRPQHLHFVKYYPDAGIQFDHVIPAVGKPGSVRTNKSRSLNDSEPGSNADVLQKYADYINGFACIVDKLGDKVALSKVTSMGDVVCCSIKKNYLHVCPTAGRCHDSNNLYALVDMAKRTVRVRCHDEECKGRNGIMAQEYDNTDDYDRHDVTSMHSQEDNISWAERYELEGAMSDYPLEPLVCVRAGMGTGKTQALKRLAATFDKQTKALIVTHSRALAAKLHSEFSDYGFVHYEKTHDSDIVDAKVVVCLDSIARVRTSSFSFVFLDEAVSLFLHLNSPLMGNKTGINLSVLELSIIQAKHVYFLDACMDHTFGKSVVDFFAAQKGVTPYWIRNTYVRPTNREIFVDVVRMEGSNVVTKASQLTRAVNKVLELLKADKNVVVCSSSKSFTVRLQNFVVKARPSTRMIVYNSDSQESLDNVAEYWKTCQLLVYSPTITAGVSFEESHFDSLVAFVSNSHHAPTVDMTLQQIMRVRELRDGDMHLFVHEFNARTEDSVPYPQTRGDIVDFLQSDIGLASKYFSTHKVNIQSVYRPSKDHVLQYDVDRLSFVVIVGILMMRNRSTIHYTSLLIDTLRFDYGIPCCMVGAAQDEMSPSELDMLKASPSKLPPVTFSEVREAVPNIDKGTVDKRIAQATKHMLDYMHNRWMVPDLDISKLETFYERVSASSAQDSYHKALRYIALCDNTLAQNKAELARSMHHMLEGRDPNIVMFKKKMHAHHMKIVLGQDYLNRLITDADMAAIRKHEKVLVPEQHCLQAYTDMVDSMPSEDADYVHNLFDIKTPTGLMVAKWVLGIAFGMDVCRRDKKQGRPNYHVIAISETYLRDMQDNFGVDLRKPKPLFSFGNQSVVSKA